MHTRDHNDENDEQWRVLTVTTALYQCISGQSWSCLWSGHNQRSPRSTSHRRHHKTFNIFWFSQCFFVSPTPPHPTQQDSQATQAHTQHQTNKQTFSENNENIFNRPENMFYCPWQPFSCDWHLMLGNGSNSSLALGSMPMVPVP